MKMKQNRFDAVMSHHIQMNRFHVPMLGLLIPLKPKKI